MRLVTFAMWIVPVAASEVDSSAFGQVCFILASTALLLAVIFHPDLKSTTGSTPL